MGKQKPQASKRKRTLRKNKLTKKFLRKLGKKKS